MSALWLVPLIIFSLGMLLVWRRAQQVQATIGELTAEINQWSGFRGHLVALDDEVTALRRSLDQLAPE